ncbi:hypothetical protein D3C73_1207650 [compost metagenome]
MMVKEFPQPALQQHHKLLGLVTDLQHPHQPSGIHEIPAQNGMGKGRKELMIRLVDAAKLQMILIDLTAAVLLTVTLQQKGTE